MTSNDACSLRLSSMHEICSNIKQIWVFIGIYLFCAMTYDFMSYDVMEW